MEVQKMNHIEIRCPADRTHIIRGVEYESCGNIIGGIEENSKEVHFHYCYMCGFSKSEIDENGMLTITKLSKGKRIKFIRKERIIKDE
jgi:hypothetical protein